MALLLTAALLHLPLVYLLIGRPEVTPVLSILVGLLSMGLAWGSGVSLEGRRSGTVLILSSFGVAEGALMFLPEITEALGNARWIFAGIALLSAVSLKASLRPS
jgi:hypothetical protein